MWIKADTINDLPAGIWDATLGRGRACLDSRLFRVAEEMFPRNGFRYFLKTEGGEPAALFMAMLGEDTPFFGVEGLDGKVFRTAATGTPETTGCHFWYDPTRMSMRDFLRESLTEIAGSGWKFDVVVYRDFIGEETPSARSAFDEFGFRAVRVLDVSQLTVPQACGTLEEYVSTLKYKYRYQLAQYRAALDPQRYETVTVEDYLPLLDELYPLYLEVCARASEYAAAPYPPDYFYRVKEAFGRDAVMVVVMDRCSGEYLGFMLLLYGAESCVHQYIGFRKIDELFLWHNLTLASVGDAIRKGIRRIDMGVTHAVAKHKFGAHSLPAWTFVAETSAVLSRLSGNT